MTRIRVQTVFGLTASVSIEAKSKRAFSELVEELKRQIPQKHRSFDRVSREWRIQGVQAMAWLEIFLARVRYDHPDVEIIRDGHKQTGARVVSSASEVESAFRALHLLPTADAEIVQAVHRVLARRHHPDAGGDPEKMKAVNHARDVVLNRLQESPA